jgi:hypothetical protein
MVRAFGFPTFVVLALLVASAGSVHAQVVCYQPAPVVAAPAPVVTSYYAPAPVATSYYAPAPVVTSYYAPAPVVTSYYAPAPVVASYYAPATVATTYRYGLFGRRSITTYSSGYYAPAPLVYTAPAVVRYGYVYP